MDDKKLNKKQLQAIKHNKGPLLIIAGAGTGKTTVITEKIKYLISKKLARPEEILALTFTEKAATEMETRVDEAMPLSYGDISITTFHSFCDSVLRESGLHIGLPTNFKLMTEAQSIDLFKRNLFNFSLNYFRPLGNPNKFIYSILAHFSRLQDELITHEDYLNWVNKKEKGINKKKITDEEKLEIQKWKELVTVYSEYNNLKLKDAKFDFGDLIIKTVELFYKRPNILLNYQQKFKYILVDEYQDTNFGQNELVNLIVQKHGNITVVGDDSQSIYRFRGASVSNILKFKETYPNASLITLNENYRSTQIILDGAYKLIKHNDPDTLEYKLGIRKQLKAVSRKVYDIKHITTNTGNEEAEQVSEEIVKLVTHKSSQYKLGDVAILVRANNHADLFIREFERRGIPHQFLGPSSLFEKEEIVDLISYLKSLYNTEDTESFYRLISSDILEIRHDEILKLLSISKKESRSLYEVFAEKKADEKFLSLFNRHLLELNKKSAGEMLYEYLNEIGIYDSLIKNDQEIKAKNISNFFQKIKTFENENPKASIFEVVDYINLLTEVGENPEVTNDNWQNENKVNILTVHSSKGLEFPVVFLVNLVTDRFPSRNRNDDLPIPDELVKEKLPDGDFHLQEERRLFYVGMTRAKERLYLASSKYYGDGKREKKISPFVLEALDKIPNSKLQIFNPSKTIEFQNQKQTTYNPQLATKKLEVNYLSVSQIETFESCPLHYKLKYIYKLPTPKTASISFGISIHETLKEIVNHKFTNSKLILENYEKNFLVEGYENKKHKELFFNKGKDYLLGFLKNGYNPKINTEALEQKFTFKITKDLKVGGTIDRIDRLGDNNLEIIDYKTGANIPTQKEVDRDLQLSVYCMAVSEMYKTKPENIKLSLYYLDTQEKISTTRTEKQLEEVKQKIIDVRNEIENSDFKCSNSYYCQKGCEYPMFCNKN
jgi:DNA helicase-2/ATP-dependent DNA helicase PcrA